MNDRVVIRAAEGFSSGVGEAIFILRCTLGSGDVMNTVPVAGHWSLVWALVAGRRSLVAVTSLLAVSSK